MITLEWYDFLRIFAIAVLLFSMVLAAWRWRDTMTDLDSVEKDYFWVINALWLTLIVVIFSEILHDKPFSYITPITLLVVMFSFKVELRWLFTHKRKERA